MARLVNFKPKDGNRYSAFDGEASYNSSDNLTECNQIHILPMKKSKFKEKKKSKIKVKTNSKKGQRQEPTIEVSTLTQTPISIASTIENHRNQIIQKQNETISTRRCHPITMSKLSGCFGNKKFSGCCRCNWQRMNCFSVQCMCCWLFSWLGCRRKCTCCNDSDNEAEDDIDATFERYKLEMGLKELSCETSENDMERCAIMPTEIMPTENFKRIEMPLESNEENNTTNNCINKNQIKTEANVVIINEPATSKVTKNDGKKSRYRKYWNWNDSWSSNSDKFLQTLEYDMDGETSLKRTNNKQKSTNAKG